MFARAKNKTRSKRPPWRRRTVVVSRLARFIFLSNLIGVTILVVGTLTLNEIRPGLLDARINSLYSQGKFIANVMGNEVTGTTGTPVLNEGAARLLLRRIPLDERSRVRLWDVEGNLIADTRRLSDNIVVSELPPVESQAPQKSLWERTENWVVGLTRALPWVKAERERLSMTTGEEVELALTGQSVSGQRYNEDGELTVSVTVPVQRVQAVLGALTIESADVDYIVDQQRRAFTPVILIALIISLLSALLLTVNIARPVRRLAIAAEQVRRANSDEIRDLIPDLSDRKDEIGDLSVVLRDMTAGLYNRIDAIANFAADVAHEIKNPLTSLRSAAETLRSAKSEKSRQKLLDILEKDVRRMDRLITDISRASRMDAELARDESRPLELPQLMADLEEFYGQTREKGQAKVVFEDDGLVKDPLMVRAFEAPLGQVFRNLIDNAITFSPEDGIVRLSLTTEEKDGRVMAVAFVDDDGPGLPPENLETVFQRFYTERPKGAAFGNHSGLGLAIARQIIEAHSGEIEARNRLGAEDEVQGARFVVRLPLIRKAQKS